MNWLYWVTPSNRPQFFYMYNYHKYLQDTRVQSQCKTLARQYRATEQLRAQRSPKMIHNHDKRVEHSILDLLSKPIQVNCFKDPVYLPREEDPSKRVVHQQMFYAYEQQPLKIAHSLERNSSLDPVPFRNPTLHQFRNLSPSTSTLKKNSDHTQSHPNLIKKDRPNNSKSTHLKAAKDYNLPQFKQRLPPLHEKHHKTYFHTLQTIVNKPDALTSTHRAHGSQSHHQMAADSEESFVLVGAENINNQKSHEIQKNKIEKIRKCRQVLEKCGLLSKEVPLQPTPTHRKSPIR